MRSLSVWRERLSLGALVTVVAAGAALLPGRAQAQQWGLYAQATGAELKVPNAGHVYGPTVGVFRMYNVGPVAVGGDVRVTVAWRGDKGVPLSDQRLDQGLFGVRVATNSHMPIGLTPYAEGLIGGGYARGGYGTQRVDSHSASLQVSAGVDYHVFGHYSWRVVEYSYDRQTSQYGSFHPQQLATGIVWRP